MQPYCLPLPPPRKIGTNDTEILYDCQRIENDNEQETAAVETIMSDPPLSAPFLDLNKSSDDEKKEEQLSWMVFKFPTRLPRLSPNSTLSGRSVRNESSSGIVADDVYSSFPSNDTPMPDAVQSSTPITESSTSSQAASGFDDTLKDAAPGKYGKVVIHKSGKAYFVIGGEDSKTPQVKMLLSEGLPCSFLQQAVSIDPNDASYVPLGEVKKSLVVTPDVESAFSK
jgi:hypothetical protein